MRIVIALGGNALLQRGQKLSDAIQIENIRAAAQQLAPVIRDHDVVITHGNGPQVGILALQAGALSAVDSSSLDVLGAESEGMISYMLERELQNVSGKNAIFATLLTQVLVSATDPGFIKPTKPIGPWYSHDQATVLEKSHGWRFVQQGKDFRRVVASPAPLQIMELQTIKILNQQGITVICTGGGGIPVIELKTGGLQGVEAVIDKDRSSALLASKINADMLVMLTDVAAVAVNYRTPAERHIKVATPVALQKIDFEAGSMGPKIEAACAFATQTGNKAAIGALTEIQNILAGTAGTKIIPSNPLEISYWEE